MRLDSKPTTTAELMARIRALREQRFALSKEHALYSEWLNNLLADAPPLREELTAQVLRGQVTHLESEHVLRQGRGG
jgi:hypothetical protein